MKLWDLRMVMSPRDFGAIRSTRRRSEPHFDYRWDTYDEDNWYRDPNDNSLVTFRGHRVLRTLIRCHFSPSGSTNSRYVYSGSEDGKVYIWNMDATLAGTVDVFSTTKNTRPPHRDYEIMGWGDDEDVSHSQWRTCVRDASWHPNAPMIVGMFQIASFMVILWLTNSSIGMERLWYVHWNLYSSFLERWC
jgi:WD repeat-containing protein 23